jgi:alpha-galactosidase
MRSMRDETLIDLRSPDLVVEMEGCDGLRLTRYELPGMLPWIDATAPNPVFALTVDGHRIDGVADGWTVPDVMMSTRDGTTRASVRLVHRPIEVEVTHHAIGYAGTALTEQWQTVRNIGERLLVVGRLDTVCLDLPLGEYQLLSFTSAWGEEFTGRQEPLRGERRLESRAGRSSQGEHPWCALLRADGGILSVSVMWSGNWILRFEPLVSGGYRLSGGLHDAEFATTLPPGETLETPHVAMALGDDADLNTISLQYARVGRRFWYPRNALSRSLPVEWNHWWSYEDRHIDDATFRRNVDVAAELGVEVCTLDAGWFGPTIPGTHWYDYRGDWDQINGARFPEGIRALADYTHERGMRFGLWCEIEGLGRHAALRQRRPELVASRAGEALGYVCFGSPKAQEWAYATLDRLIVENACDWIKLDFNVDPGLGCDRDDHGHGPDNGLLAHYRGYYAVLERLRQRYPEVLLESCSSGGLRIDLGLMRHTHTTFLSDPDWPVHNLALFWGATLMLAPEVCLHWSYSDWVNPRPHQTFDPQDPNLRPHQLDYYTRTAMLGGFGFSQRLPDLPTWVTQRLAGHIRTYQQTVRRFVCDADLYRLTEQPRRDGSGERWVGFQYAMPDGSEHLLFAFRLPGAEPERTLRLRTLDPDRLYAVTWLGHERSTQSRGDTLMREGLPISGLHEEDSAILLIA